LAPGIEAALDLEPCQIQACLNIIDERQEQIEIAQGLPPRSERLSPQLQAIFGPGARKGTAADLAGLIGRGV
jgi:hypothetical protein